MAGGNDAAVEVRASAQKKKKSKPIPSTEEQQEAKNLEVLPHTLHYRRPVCECCEWHTLCVRECGSANSSWAWYMYTMHASVAQVTGIAYCACTRYVLNPSQQANACTAERPSGPLRAAPCQDQLARTNLPGPT
eukprot:1184037-Prorocentrum_minimum.AAC.7